MIALPPDAGPMIVCIVLSVLGAMLAGLLLSLLGDKESK